jgi:hypothetical protein
MGTYLRS